MSVGDMGENFGDWGGGGQDGVESGWEQSKGSYLDHAILTHFPFFA